MASGSHFPDPSACMSAYDSMWHKGKEKLKFYIWTHRNQNQDTPVATYVWYSKSVNHECTEKLGIKCPHCMQVQKISFDSLLSIFPSLTHFLSHMQELWVSLNFTAIHEV